MEKCWFIQIEGKKEGPFTYVELKRDKRLTPDTLVWKKGFTTWKPIREVPELADLFKEEEPVKEEPEEEKIPALSDEVIAIQAAPPDFTLWIIILAVILTYFLTQLYWGR